MRQRARAGNFGAQGGLTTATRVVQEVGIATAGRGKLAGWVAPCWGCAWGRRRHRVAWRLHERGGGVACFAFKWEDSLFLMVQPAGSSPDRGWFGGFKGGNGEVSFGMMKRMVPRSSKKLYEDNEYALYTVTLFGRVADNFKTSARERGFQARISLL
ncbi:hypothetical protein IEQ34_011243 [Dendrobium chrysotoxum]|uniref:V-type proton ATPase subunit C n=1 Tax=Dendrobium chrysotoxum TaxID=161865 RepID=A0AAV7GZA2_DENCH|nr:hypothetical protein IEQ34_011243 [Dendrobium chrysotoxum]